MSLLSLYAAIFEETGDRSLHEALTGSCLCGAVHYALKPGYRMKPYACHCTDCQKRTGSAFSSHMAVMEQDLTITGELTEGHVVQPSGANSTIVGCKTCMSRIYAKNDKRAGMISIRVRTLDISSSSTPAAHLWVKSKQPWIVIPDDVPALETQPQSSKEWMQLLGPDP